MGVASDYRRIATRFRSLPETMVRAGAVEMQRAIVERLRADTGGDAVLSGASRKGRRRKLNASVAVSGGQSLATATVQASPPKALGQWGWLEEGTAERTMSKLHMQLPSGAWRTGPWTASGSPAKRTFTDGVTRGRPAAERAMVDAWEREVG